MKYIVGTFLILAILGAFVAPPYNYTHEEQARLKDHERSIVDYAKWPIRAYDNWQNCGSIRYCEETRCAALEGGCAPPPSATSWERTLKAPVRSAGEPAAAWQARVDGWCASKKGEYESWLLKRAAAEKKCQPRLPGAAQNQQAQSSPAAPKPSNSTGIQIDTSNLVDCRILQVRPVLADEFEAHCR